MSKPLIIVESLAKTKTLKNFLGGRFELAASLGHVRDLPEREFGVDIERDFAPTYVVLADRNEQLARLKRAVAEADRVYIATDPDREGEAIAWHLKEALELKEPKRIEFNEITKTAVERALEHPRDIDMRRVNAQQARRILDRLVGYKISPFLWRTIGDTKLSAGRVQSVALRLIVERERIIRDFVPEEYWTIAAQLTPDKKSNTFRAELRAKGKQKIHLPNKEATDAVLEDLRNATYIVQQVNKGTRKRYPAPPFITSTLQQEASRKLGFSAKQTMRIAQELYEGVDLGPEGSVGLITYMRTDSTRVADEAKDAAASLIRQRFGPEYLHSGPTREVKVKGAQEAHEAIRPTDPHRTPESVATFLTAQQRKLYELIWNRFTASQMAHARYEVTTVDIKAGDYRLRAVGSVVLFPGFTVVYTETSDNGPPEETAPPLPPLEKGQQLILLDLLPKQHFTEPPPRYTEASLVKALEQHGIGRPSTYAQILSVIVERRYVTRQKKTFYPTELGEKVCDALVGAFPSTFDVRFTAHMEIDLDKIADNGADWVEVVREFYQPMQEQLEVALGIKGRTCPKCSRPMVVKQNWRGEFLGCSGYPECKETAPLGPPPEETDQVCEKCGKPMLLLTGRGGRFLACSGYPECRFTRRANGEQRPEPKPTDELCPQCGSPMVIRTGRTGEFYACTGFPKCKFTRSLDGEEATVRPSDKVCPVCGSPMVIRKGRTGEFYACTAYPKCKKTLPIVSEDAVPCVVCGDGKMVPRRSKRGRLFYGCSRYPECENATSDPPTGEKCPLCGGSLVQKMLKSKTSIRCGRKGCSYAVPTEGDAPNSSEAELAGVGVEAGSSS